MNREVTPDSLTKAEARLVLDWLARNHQQVWEDMAELVRRMRELPR